LVSSLSRRRLLIGVPWWSLLVKLVKLVKQKQKSTV